MNAMMKVQHIMQAVDWSRFDLEGWLYQFGAWIRSTSGVCGQSINPIAVAMDEAVKKRKIQKIEGKEQMIADWLKDETTLRPVGKNVCCEITDTEARAVQRLILDLQGQSLVLDEWLDAIIARYFYGNSWPNMVKKTVNTVGDEVIIYSQMDARSDVKCGLAALHVRYGFIQYNLKYKA